MSDKRPAWDLFISHASEDKETLVRPLATELSRLGLRVWYDEFSLRLGDSLTATIDRGLAESEFGLVIISPAFITKPWPKRELAGLVAGETGRNQVILPVWYNVSRDQVLEFSPPLADKVAIDAIEIEVPELALRILERVKPELHQAYLRKLAYLQMIAEAKKEIADARDLLPGPIRRETLPIVMANRIRLFREALVEVLPLSWLETLDGFRRDLNPENEVVIWEFVASIYLTIVNEFELSHAEREQLYHKIFVKIAAGDIEHWEVSDASPAWEKRAFALASLSVDQNSESFGSLSGTEK